MILSEAKITAIKDSRSSQTIEAHLTAHEGNGKEVSVKSSVPSGKSTGTYEVKSLNIATVFEQFEKIKRNIIGVNFRDQQEFDRLLIALDGSSDKHILGGNLILALSEGFARAFSGTHNLELNQYLHQLLEQKSEVPDRFPRPLFNIINGGAHVTIPKSWNKKFNVSKPLDIQEFQVVPTVDDFALGLSVGKEFYSKLGRELKKIYGEEGVVFGDEAGYVCPFKTNEEALEIIQELINHHLYPLKIGLDAAASQFHNDVSNLYSVEGIEITPEELAMLYYDFAHAYELISLEDPFNEEAFDDFSRLQAKIPETIIITDDLTTTNPERLFTAISKKSANAILIKPNQIGTVTETIDVISMAYKSGWKTIVSHRSGETKDDFIADLAVGVGAWGLKSGAPATEYRMAKYSRALELWQKNNSSNFFI